MMNAKKKVTVAALALALLVGWIGAADVKPPIKPEDLAKAIAEAGRPGSEHARLQPLAGNWTYTCRCWMDPSSSPCETNGVIERKWILGGRFLEERISGTGFDGKPGFEGVGLIGYNNTTKEYITTFACNMGTGLSTGVGSFQSPGSFTFQTKCACPLSKEPVCGRNVIRFESDDRIVTETYNLVEGKEVKAMELVAIRKK